MTDSSEQLGTANPLASALRNIGSFFWELVKVFLIAVVIIIPIRYFLVQPFFVRGASMEPVFSDGEYLIIDELSYRFREPRRGEVVVFRYPNDPSQFFIKRIIGLPGDTVRISDGRVFIQNRALATGAVLDESTYLGSTVRTGGQVELSVPDDQYFVMGDNRPASSDSRSWGTLPGSNIVGRTWLRAWPIDRLTIFDLPHLGFLGS